VSAVCSVTDEPPTLMVCINRESRNAAAFRASGALCVNVVSADQQALAQLFASKTASVEQRFAAGRWSRLVTGAPALDDALASLDCEVRSVIEVGTHSVFLCEIKAIRTAEKGDALIYFGRHFHRLAAAAGAAS
jgi:flavin reductase